jgi:hypothetical protein
MTESDAAPLLRAGWVRVRADNLAGIRGGGSP